MDLKIATADNRKSTKWKNTKISWSDFLDRLDKPTVTQESWDEYKAMSKDKRAEVKDVGGFVGGWLKGGKRKAGHVQSRSLLTLDLDEAGQDLVEELDLLFSWKGAIYSTHSHQEESPRYRLVYPLSREVSADEYQAIARYVADQVGMDQFDPTSFQPERLMYWPSHAREADYTSAELEGDLLDVDKVLESYPDWTDASYWPLHPTEKVGSVHKGKSQKMEDPRAKGGWIGAFCRAYSVSEAIEAFLSEVYEPGSSDNRYTYKDGSTSDGLVVYDDLFAYSHHGTDPISGRSVNAFDLVRLHLFGGEDQAGLSPSKQASFQKMVDRLEKDKRTLDELNKIALEGAQEDFSGIDGTDDKKPVEGNIEGDKEGVSFRFTQDGKLKKDPYNLELILEKSKAFKGKLGFNEFTGNFEKLGLMPWEDEFDPDWSDADTAQLKSYVNRKYMLVFGDDRIIDCLLVVSKKKPFNPVKDYIRSEEWDGISRVGQIFIDYLGAEDTDYVREVTELWFAGAVARVYRPGCKFDVVPVLVGSQGLGKSTLIGKLGDKWFTDGLQKLDGNKDDLQILSQSWLVELSELASMKRTGMDQAKGFISRTADLYRPAYGRMTVNQKRRVVFIGSTNNNEFLKDMTGNRRWYPINCHAANRVRSVFDESLDKVIGQLWAEAYDLYKNRYDDVLVLSAVNEEVAKEVRRGAEAPDVTRDAVIDYLATPKPAEWHEMTRADQAEFLEDIDQDTPFNHYKDSELELQDFVTSREIYDLTFGTYETKTPGQTSRANAEIRKIGMVLSNLDGWSQEVKKIGGKSLRGFSRILTNRT